jgi:hypothetical protein
MGDARPRLRVRIRAPVPWPVDVPVAHKRARFGVGYPYMVADCPTYTTDINMIPLNIAEDRVYNFLLGFISEMSRIFPDEFIHTVKLPRTAQSNHSAKRCG